MGNETVQFLGAAGTVTGSKHLVSTGDHQVLLDCGLFQGLKALRLRNWEPPPLDVQGLDAVILSHAHIDHTGLVPRLVKEGYDGDIITHAATCDLADIMLRDSGHIQEEDAPDSDGEPELGAKLDG